MKNFSKIFDKFFFKHKILFFTAALLLILVGGILYFLLFNKTEVSKYANLPIMKVSQLAEFNGDDDNKPIYLGLNGLVYDVTPGREFYNKEGSYHDLAGKDSSELLNWIGGDIIKRKYKVIARLE